jgi:hypothetical protein
MGAKRKRKVRVVWRVWLSVSRHCDQQADVGPVVVSTPLAVSRVVFAFSSDRSLGPQVGGEFLHIVQACPINRGARR